MTERRGVGQQSDRARDALLNAAEELFAVHGIDAVSNRRIVEHAGAANHSAVTYHFGGRDGLLRALIVRHIEAMAPRRAETAAGMGASPTVHELVSGRLTPLFEVFEALPRPNWRAQFLSQVRSTPSAAKIAKSAVMEAGVDHDVRLLGQLHGIPADVVRGRFYLLAHLVLGVCADQEATMNEGTQQEGWADVGSFLIDAAAGMLAAPISRPDGLLHGPLIPFL
jgi:AcrR family transcriptional regulator